MDYLGLVHTLYGQFTKHTLVVGEIFSPTQAVKQGYSERLLTDRQDVV